MGETLRPVEMAHKGAKMMMSPITRSLLLFFIGIPIFGDMIEVKYEQEHAEALEDEGGGGGHGH